MDVRITVETTFDTGEKRIHQLDTISRPYRVTCPEAFGLRLEDGKKIVGQIQKAILCDQVRAHFAARLLLSRSRYPGVAASGHVRQGGINSRMA